MRAIPTSTELQLQPVLMKRKLTISVVALIIVVSSALIVRHNRNFKLDRPAQAAFLELLESDPIITLSECPGPQPSSEFFELLPKAIGRVKLSFDSDRTENRWACACAFWIMIDQESASAIVDQHHLLVGEKYHILNGTEMTCSS